MFPTARTNATIKWQCAANMGKCMHRHADDNSSLFAAGHVACIRKDAYSIQKTYKKEKSGPPQQRLSFSLDRSPDRCVTKKQPFIRPPNVRTHTRRKEECTSQITPPPLSHIRRLPRRESGLATLVEPTWLLAGLACSSFLPGSEEPGHKGS
jgi:hypothetical protein